MPYITYKNNTYNTTMTSSDQSLFLASSESLSGEHPTAEATANTFDQIAFKLHLRDVKFLRVAWCDTANVIRAKAAYVPRLEGVFKDGIALCVGNQVNTNWDAFTASRTLS